MARIRTIKPEFWTDEKIVECSTTARLLFIGLWNFCDDYGSHQYSPKQIKMEVFPGDDFKISKIEEWLSELINARLINTYTIDDKRYLRVCGWRHQKIEKPSRKYPDPIQFDDHSTTIRRPFDDDSPAEGKGREGKGKEHMEGGYGGKPNSVQPPVDNSSQNTSQSDDQPRPGGNGLLTELKNVIEDISHHVKDTHKQRQIMLFVESNIKRRNPNAILHCLKSLGKQIRDGTDISSPGAYLSASLKIEDGKHNAAEHEEKSKTYKDPITKKGMETLGAIFSSMSLQKQ